MAWSRAAIGALLAAAAMAALLSTVRVGPSDGAGASASGYGVGSERSSCARALCGPLFY